MSHPNESSPLEKLGFSGSVARAFQANAITPLLALVALLLVVGLILALAWLARRLPGMGAATGNRNLKLVGSLSIGPRERVVVVDVGGTQLLLSTGAGGTRTLHTLEQPLPEPEAGPASPFAQVLAQHFGKNK